MYIVTLMQSVISENNATDAKNIIHPCECQNNF